MTYNVFGGTLNLAKSINNYQGLSYKSALDVWSSFACLRGRSCGF